jgi:hypothetical protein
MELIKQIEAILEARKQRRKGRVPNLLPTEETYRLMGDARFELASLRKNG